MSNPKTDKISLKINNLTSKLTNDEIHQIETEYIAIIKSLPKDENGKIIIPDNVNNLEEIRLNITEHVVNKKINQEKELKDKQKELLKQEKIKAKQNRLEQAALILKTKNAIYSKCEEIKLKQQSREQVWSSFLAEQEAYLKQCYLNYEKEKEEIKNELKAAKKELTDFNNSLRLKRGY